MARNDKIALTGSKEATTHNYQRLFETAATKLTREQIESAERIALAGNATAITQSNIEAQNNLDVAEKSINAENNAKVANAERAAYIDGQYDTMMSHFKPDETRKKSFVIKYIKPFFEKYKESGVSPSVAEVTQAIAKNAKEYNIDVDDAMAICNALGVNTDWLSNYIDNPDDKYGGMISK